ncbi:MAG: hypothetical protein WBE76_31310 [Terracidiphilus sp.]
MLQRNLQSDQFATYPPLAKKLALSNLSALQRLPLSFLPGLLRELIEYDFKFPAERTAIEKELASLSSLTQPQNDDWFRPFSRVTLSSDLERFDWVNRPAQFVEQESAYLWSTGQLDAFRNAATDYGDRLRAATPAAPLPVRRLGIAVIGQEVASYDRPLFRNLRAHGTYFENVKAERGLELLLSGVEARAKAHPAPYGHWYVDGGREAEHSPLLTCVSYDALEPTRTALLKYMQTEIARPGMGPEELRTNLARLLPSDLGKEKEADPVLDRFQVKLFTEGSGTQIFSTTFAQWAAREALRRAQPLTLLVRFAPRQRQKPMNELLSGGRGNIEPDPVGSLIDADMGAYYHWINQQRLAGSDQSAFLVWFEGHGQALSIGPTLPRGTQSSSALDLGELISLTVS